LSDNIQKFQEVFMPGSIASSPEKEKQYQSSDKNIKLDRIDTEQDKSMVSMMIDPTASNANIGDKNELEGDIPTRRLYLHF